MAVAILQRARQARGQARSNFRENLRSQQIGGLLVGKYRSVQFYARKRIQLLTEFYEC